MVPKEDEKVAAPSAKTDGTEGKTETKAKAKASKKEKKAPAKKTAKEPAAEDGEKSKKKPKVAKAETYKLYIYKVLKQVSNRYLRKRIAVALHPRHCWRGKHSVLVAPNHV